MRSNLNNKNMKRINFIVIVLVWLSCTAIQCESDKCHKVITFVNKSSKEVYVYNSSNSDTSNFRFPNPYNQPDIYKVNSGKKNDLWDRDCYESQIKQGQVIVYVFDAEVLANYSWGTVKKNYMVLKTIRPTLEEMQNNNWTIYFTGD